MPAQAQMHAQGVRNHGVSHQRVVRISCQSGCAVRFFCQSTVAVWGGSLRRERCSLPEWGWASPGSPQFRFSQSSFFIYICIYIFSFLFFPHLLASSIVRLPSPFRAVSLFGDVHLSTVSSYRTHAHTPVSSPPTTTIPSLSLAPSPCSALPGTSRRSSSSLSDGPE